MGSSTLFFFFFFFFFFLAFSYPLSLSLLCLSLSSVLSFIYSLFYNTLKHFCVISLFLSLSLSLYSILHRVCFSPHFKSTPLDSSSRISPPVS